MFFFFLCSSRKPTEIFTTNEIIVKYNYTRNDEILYVPFITLLSHFL